VNVEPGLYLQKMSRASCQAPSQTIISPLSSVDTRSNSFAQRFIDTIQVRCAEKAATVRFYPEKLRSAASVDHDHAEVRATLGVPAEFVIYSLRHTYGAWLGEAGADAFAIMR
jgi:hypothetical protein